MKNGRIDKYSKGLLMDSEYVIIHRWIYPDYTFFSIGVRNNGYLQALTSGQGALFFDSEKSAIKYIKKYRGKDLSNPDHKFRIIIQNVAGLDISSEPI